MRRKMGVHWIWKCSSGKLGVLWILAFWVSSLYATTESLGQVQLSSADSNSTEGDIGTEALNFLKNAAKTSNEEGNPSNETMKDIAIKEVEKLFDALEDDAQKDTGRFNDTISNQGGVLETVARVGQHSLDEEESVTDDIIKKDDASAAAVEQTNITAIIEKHVPEEPLVRKTGNISDSAAMGQSPPTNITKDAADRKNSTNSKTDQSGWRPHKSEDVARLIDREDNEYVISNPGKRSQMQYQEDLTLIRDIVIVIVASAVGAVVCGMLGQPVILGYLAAGMVVGPGGLSLVHELVQVETLAQFGVVFLLFALGVEFSVAKMQGVQAVALGGGCIQILTAMTLCGLLCSSVPQGVFIGAFLSMSSTAVVVKCMMDANMGGTESGQILLGTLIVQDCALGLLLAVMPALAAKGSSSGTIFMALARESMMLAGFCGVAWLLAKMLVPTLLSSLVRLSKNSSELYQLGIVGVCLLISLLSQGLGLGLEVGSFVAGLMLSGNPYSEKTLHQLEPVRNIFASLFLASIGMVMNPVFLWQHKDILLASLGVMFFGKTVLIALVVRGFGYSSATSTGVGIALAQIGEFSFVLLSRAQGLGLVSRKLYLLLMGTSAFSLVLTPFAFKIVVRLVPRDKRLPSYAYHQHQHHQHHLLHHHHHHQHQHQHHHHHHQFTNEDDDNNKKIAITDTGTYECNSKDGGGEKVLLPQITLRRPFSWRQWKDLGEFQRLYRI